MPLRPAPWLKHPFRNRDVLQRLMVIPIVIVSGLLGVALKPHPHALGAVAGQNYQICNLQSQYLTSPWTYHALASGSQSYTVAQYQALSGYGTTLPPLPSYVASEPSSTTAAVIFAPGSTDVSSPAYAFPESPILYFFEGGSYGQLSLDTVSGDQFIGGSATGFPEPQFNNGGAAAGISGQNGSHYFSGGSSTLASSASIGATSISIAAAIPGYINYVTFADGSSYRIASNSGTTITLNSALISAESAGSAVWANSDQQLAKVSGSAAQGSTTLTLGASSIPLMQWENIMVGTHQYQISSVTGSQSGYTINIGSGGLDTAVAANTPIFYSDNSGNVNVSYLDIANDQHVSTGTIYTGSGWTITHNNIHDGYSKGPGYGVGIYGGDNSTIEYNCISKMGDYAVQIDGTNNKLDYNEIFDSSYQPDPGCGCSGAGKWWGSMNADIVGNAFINDGPGGQSVIWLDNGNTGTLISDNYFEKSWGPAVESETGFNLDITNNLFQDGGWGSGSGGGDNNDGAIDINSSGGFQIPGSRYENQIAVTDNQFVNDWMGINVWQAGGRSCENSGEGWPDDADYCSGGFPNTSYAAAGGQYYFSHIGKSTNQGGSPVIQASSSGSTTVLTQGAEAINDQIGFADPAETTTTSTTNVSTLSNSTINAAATASFPSSGQLRVGTSAAWADGGGGFTGAILSYTGKTSTSFTGVALLRGSGTLAGPVEQVQPYKVVSQTCYANDCAVTVSPALAANVASGATVYNSGTCQLFATSAATPTSPLAPSGTSYYDGCQWGTANISVNGNYFSFDAAAIAAGTTLGGHVGTTCTTSHTNSCGTNFMAFQPSGEKPYDTFIGGNAMMSNSNLTGCPSWDSGCTTNPLKNINASSSPPSAPANNGEAAENNVWANNTYGGPWAWNVDWYGTCGALPTDTATGHSMPSSPNACNLLDFAHWQSDWQQESGSTYSATPNAPAASISAAPTTITSGQSSTLTWSSSNATGCSATTPSGFSISGTSGTKSVSPTSTTTYSISCTGTNGTATASTTVTVATAAKVGDFNNDGQVNISDLSILLTAWGTTNSTIATNLNNAGAVGINDLSIFLSHWGT